MSASPTRLAAARADAYARQAAAIRTRVQVFASARFAAGQFYDADVARFVSQVAPIVLAGRKQTAALTDAYLSSVMKSAGITVPVHKPVDTAALRGVPVDEVLTRPFKTARAGIFTDGIDAARQAGEARLMDIIGTDMQMSRTYTSRNVLSGSRAAGYMRVPSGGRTCALCEIASTQMYHTDVLMPIHPSCQCGVEIVTDSNPWDQSAADKRLEDTHASVFDRLGVNDAGGRAPDYRKIIVTNDHGEIGPMLGIKGQHFTGPDLKAAAYRTESSNTARNAAFAPKKTQEWGRVHADRLLPSDASLAERNRFASLLSQHPERVVKKVKSITVAASDAEMQAAAKAVGFTDAHGVAAFWDGKGITLKPGFDDVTFHHEMGHAVSDFTAKAKVKPYYDQYQISPQFDRHTDYSKTSPRESFAESYAAFVASGSPLKKVSDPYYELTFSVLRKVLS